MLKKALKRNKGITLIALVVTIIVLLILAGISISMLTGQNGILNRAQEAKEEYSNSSEKEQIQLSYNSAMTNKLGDTITAENLQNELDEMLGKNSDGTSKTEITDRGDGVFYVKFVETNHNYKVDNGKVSLQTGEDKSVVEPKNVADWAYNVNDDGTLTITGYKGSDTDVVIPNYISGVKVKKIESSKSNSIWSDDIRDSNESIYYGCAGVHVQKTIKRITISYGIEEIGQFAFCGTVGMNNVNIPSTLTNIGGVAFYGCKSLANINIPSSVESIGWNAFEYCSSLTNVTIQSGVMNIGSSAFAECSSLANITIPSSVTSIEDGTFANCSSLTNITIPSSVTSIGGGAFHECSSLTNITIPSSVTSIEDGTFANCSSLTNITIPSSVTSIGGGAFHECSSLTNITIPSSVTSIGVGSFSFCSKLTNITIPSSVTSIGGGAFQECSSLNNITIPSKVTSMGSEVFYGIPSITVTVPYKLGENPPSGWDSEWNSTKSDCKVKIKYQE